MTDLLRSVVLDAQGGGSGVLLNGEPFPYWVSEDIDIEPGGKGSVTIVNLPLLVDGVVLILDRKGKRRVIDGDLTNGLGDVGEWARQHVRDELTAAFPWLRIEPELGPVGRRLGDAANETPEAPPGYPFPHLPSPVEPGTQPDLRPTRDCGVPR